MRKIAAACAAMAVLFPQVVWAASQLSLLDAIRLAIAARPSVAAARIHAEATMANAGGTAGFPGPEVTLHPSLVGPQKDVVGISQSLTEIGRQQTRRTIADRQAEQAALELWRQQQEVAHQTSLAYVALQAAQQTVSVQKANVQLSARFLEVARAQYRAGNVPHTNILRAEIELANAQQALGQAQSSQALQQETLEAWIAQASPSVPPLSHVRIDPIREDEAVDNRPEVRLAEEQVEIAKTEYALQQSERWPDFSLEGFVDDPRDLANNTGLAVSLRFSPWTYTTLGERIRSAQLNASAAERSAAEQKLRAQLEIRSAYRRYQQARQASETIERKALRQTETLYALAQEGFRLGANGYLDVLDAQRALLSARLNHIQALLDENSAAADYLLATGAGFKEGTP